MSEALSSPEQARFESPRDEVLYRIGRSGWAGVTAGDTNALPGRFTWLNVLDDELTDAESIFGVDIRLAKLERAASLVGHWVMLEDQQNVITVLEMENFDQAQQTFEALLTTYEEFGSGDLGS